MCALGFVSLQEEIKANIFMYIMSDSQAALKALKTLTFKSKLVAECLDVLKRLTLKCTFTLGWVPGYKGVEGNEIADQLANEGSTHGKSWEKTTSFILSNKFTFLV
jgi:ribonuclease HI